MRYVILWLLVSLAACQSTTVPSQDTTKLDKPENTAAVAVKGTTDLFAPASVPESHQSNEGGTIGKLGQARPATPIYAKPDPHSDVYYQLAKFQYVVINETSTDGWTGVLLQNGRTAVSYTHLT